MVRFYKCENLEYVNLNFVSKVRITKNDDNKYRISFWISGNSACGGWTHSLKKFDTQGEAESELYSLCELISS